MIDLVQLCSAEGGELNTVKICISSVTIEGAQLQVIHILPFILSRNKNMTACHWHVLFHTVIKGDISKDGVLVESS